MKLLYYILKYYCYFRKKIMFSLETDYLIWNFVNHLTFMNYKCKIMYCIIIQNFTFSISLHFHFFSKLKPLKISFYFNITTKLFEIFSWINELRNLLIVFRLEKHPFSSYNNKKRRSITKYINSDCRRLVRQAIIPAFKLVYGCLIEKSAFVLRFV